jgi:TRAP transporter TAXI family solute receptor
MEWYAGPQGGGWYTIAEGLVDLIKAHHHDLDLRVTAGGGKENLAHIERGEAQFCMSIDFLVAAAARGHAPFDGQPMTRINCLGTGWSPLPFHLLRASSVGDDLGSAIIAPGFRIAVPAKNTSDELTFQRVLSFYDTSYERIDAQGGCVTHGNYDEIVRALKDGAVDYLFGATTKPAAIIADAGRGPRLIQLASLPANLMDHLTKAYGYGRGIIPAGTYPALQSHDIVTTFMETIFVISADVEEGVAFDITKTLLTNARQLRAINASMGDFDPATAWKKLPTPLHSGARRAYQDLGFIPFGVPLRT